MKFLFSFMLYISSFSCTFSKPDNNIIIRGVVKNIPANRLYLTDAYDPKDLKDSADYVNDTFSFHFSSKGFEPYLAAIRFFDDSGKRHSLFIENYLLSTDDAKYAGMGFMIDKGLTTISGSYNNHPTIKTDKLKIEGSKQNDPLFKTQLSDFGWINTQDKVKRREIINNYKNLIKQYPYSYYFIHWLYAYRTNYSKEELMEMLALFNDEIQHHSSYTNKFFDYFNTMPVPGKPLINYTLNDSLGSLQNIIQSTKLNMIIFWASWCGPCRAEIPELKKIYSECRDKDINIVSVSIDTDSAMWVSALKKEQMNWRQLIVEPSLMNKVKNSFNFSSIPIIIFTDSTGMEISRIMGNEPNNKNEYRNIISKYLSKF